MAQRDGRETTVEKKPDDMPEPGPAPKDELEEAPDEDAVTPTAGMAPPAAEARGGCAACTVGDGSEDATQALAWLALGASLLSARRRVRARARARGTSSRRS